MLISFVAAELLAGKESLTEAGFLTGAELVAEAVVLEELTIAGNAVGDDDTDVGLEILEERLAVVVRLLALSRTDTVITVLLDVEMDGALVGDELDVEGVSELVVERSVVLVEPDVETDLIVGADDEVEVFVLAELDCADVGVLADVVVKKVLKADDGVLFEVVVDNVDEVGGVVLGSILDEVVELRDEVVLRTVPKDTGGLEDEIVWDVVLEVVVVLKVEAVVVLKTEVVVNSLLGEELVVLDDDVVVDNVLEEGLV